LPLRARVHGARRRSLPFLLSSFFLRVFVLLGEKAFKSSARFASLSFFLLLGGSNL
jgi:hypothetical protein